MKTETATERRPPSLLRRLAWLLVGLLQLGLIAGAFQLGSRLAAPGTAGPAEPPETELPLVAPWKQTPVEPAEGPAARGELDEVDRLVRIGRYELGLTLCRSFNDRAAAELRDAFQYRLALCLEGLGHWDEALVAYRKLTGHTASVQTSAVALLGQARVWLRMRRPVEARALLCDLARRSALPELRDRPFLTDARYLIALAAALEILPNEAPGPFNENPASPLASDWPMDRALDWDKSLGALTKPRAPDTPPPGEEVIEVQPGAIVVVRIFVQQMPVAGLLDRLAEKAHLRIEWTPRARQQVEGRSLIVALERTSLTDALRILAEPLGLVWTIHGTKLAFSSEEEALPAELQTLRLDNARRALREAVLNAPNHALAPVAYLELGNLEARAGRLDEALAWYGRLTREWTRSKLVIEAQYNHGLLLSGRGDRPGARQALYRVVDRAPAHELAPLAYWRVGRDYLEEGDPEQALSPLRRALRSGPGTSAHAAAAITMAAAHLLTDNPRAANAILLEHRELIAGEPYRKAAAFLDTLARFRAVTDRRLRQREASDLLAALLVLHDDALLGTGGLVLMGQAYQELGMQAEMMRAYEQALPKLHGRLAAQMSLALAEAYWSAEKREAAVNLFTKLSAGGSANEARRARRRLAEIALEQKKPQDCLKFCRELLQDRDSVDVPALLRLMAGAYEQTGERDKAIRCLSGTLP